MERYQDEGYGDCEAGEAEWLAERVVVDEKGGSSRRWMAGRLLFWLAAVLVLVCSPLSAKEFRLSVDSDELVYGVSCRENASGNVNAVGDKHLRHKAYGLLQIRAPYLADVNRIAGKVEIRRRWGKDRLTMEDMKDKAKAEWAFHVYVWHYGSVYMRKTGRVPTAYVYARIHNGGPDGWKKGGTVQYGKDVLAYIASGHLRTTTGRT
jgi:hypothetical protein